MKKKQMKIWRCYHCYQTLPNLHNRSVLLVLTIKYLVKVGKYISNSILPGYLGYHEAIIKAHFYLQVDQEETSLGNSPSCVNTTPLQIHLFGNPMFHFHASEPMMTLNNINEGSTVKMLPE